MKPRVFFHLKNFEKENEKNEKNKKITCEKLILFVEKIENMQLKDLYTKNTAHACGHEFILVEELSRPYRSEISFENFSTICPKTIL